MSDDSERYKWYTQEPKVFRRRSQDWLFDGSKGGEVGYLIKKLVQSQDSQPKRYLSKALGSRVAKGIFVVLIIGSVGVFLKRDGQKSDAEIIFDNLESIALGSAGVIFLLEIKDRRKRDHYNAWNVINSALGQTGSGGRVQALEDLHRDGVNLEGVAAPRADLSEIDLSFGKLRRANFERTQFSKANLRKAALGYANLERATLREADLEDAALNHTNLKGAALGYANLHRAILVYADLQAAALGYANLKGASLKYANLTGAFLDNANLEGVSLGYANLKGASLKDANLEDANLEFASLEEATGLTQDQLVRAKLCSTNLPENISLPPNRDCEEMGIDSETGRYTKKN